MYTGIIGIWPWRRVGLSPTGPLLSLVVTGRKQNPRRRPRPPRVLCSRRSCSRSPSAAPALPILSDAHLDNIIEYDKRRTQRPRVSSAAATKTVFPNHPSLLPVPTRRRLYFTSCRRDARAHTADAKRILSFYNINIRSLREI